MADGGTPPVLADERARRQRAVDFARGSVRFEGFLSSPEQDELDRRFVAGEITIGERRAAVMALCSWLIDVPPTATKEAS